MNMTGNNSSELDIEIFAIKKGLKLFKAVNSGLRQEMLDLIHKRGAITVTELFTELNLEQPVASNHLAILRDAGLVISKRVGKNVFYSIDYNRIKFLHSKSNDLLDFRPGPKTFE